MAAPKKKAVLQLADISEHMAESGASQDSTPNPASTSPKTLKITFSTSSKLPLYEFTGTWSGRDIRVVQNLTAREYRKYQLEIRKQLATDNTSQEGQSNERDTKAVE